MSDPIDVEEHEETYWDGTIDHLKNLAYTAAARAHCALDYHQRRDLALSSVLMILAEAPDATVSHVVRQAQLEVMKESTTITRSHGMDAAEGEMKPRFITYWLDVIRPSFYPTYGLSNQALHQVWEKLTDEQQETLLGRTVTHSNTELGELLGVHPSTAAKRLREARRTAMELWFDWETSPPPPIDMKRRERTHCPSGHDLDEHGVLTKKAGSRTYRCRECEREYHRKKTHHDD